MELFLLLLLLSLADKNAELKDTLQRVLSFYRENREWLLLLSGRPPQKEETGGKEPPKDPAPAETKENSPGLGGDLRILEAFLKQRGA